MTTKGYDSVAAAIIGAYGKRALISFEDASKLADALDTSKPLVIRDVDLMRDKKMDSYCKACTLATLVAVAFVTVAAIVVVVGTIAKALCRL